MFVVLLNMYSMSRSITASDDSDIKMDKFEDYALLLFSHDEMKKVFYIYMYYLKGVVMFHSI